MAQAPKKKKRRPRTVPKTIATKTDREIMETVFGKRIVEAADAEVKSVKQVASSMDEE